MSSFVGIQISSELQGKVSSFCQTHRYTSSEPYIELLSETLIKDVPLLQQKLESFCLSQPEFRLVIGAPNLFDNKLLYLAVMPGMINMMRDRLIKHLQIRGCGVYRPYLPLIKQQTARSFDLEAILEDANNTFKQSHSFTVGEITLFNRITDQHPYVPVENIPFTGR